MKKPKAGLDRATIQRIAEMFGVKRDTSRKWFRKDRAVPKAWRMVIEAHAKKARRT